MSSVSAIPKRKPPQVREDQLHRSRALAIPCVSLMYLSLSSLSNTWDKIPWEKERKGKILTPNNYLCRISTQNEILSLYSFINTFKQMYWFKQLYHEDCCMCWKSGMFLNLLLWSGRKCFKQSVWFSWSSSKTVCESISTISHGLQKLELSRMLTKGKGNNLSFPFPDGFWLCRRKDTLVL